MDNQWQIVVLLLFLLSLLSYEVECQSCAIPYSCIGLDECEQLHANNEAFSFSVLVYCSARRTKVCCPPYKLSHSPNVVTVPRPTIQTSSSFLTTEPPARIAPIPKPPNKSVLEHRNLKLLQQKCGVLETFKITGGTNASIGEFPWMALIGFRDKRGNIHYKCGGTLINDRYILTAAHCLDKVDDTELNHVRLGEFIISEERDCVNPDFPFDCIRALDVPIEKAIPHERWQGSNGNNRDDIALLKLRKSASPLISERVDIQPICLPINEQDVTLNEKTVYEAAGWGLTNYMDHEQSDILQKVTFSDNNEADCSRICFRNSIKYCPISEKQLCIQGLRRRDVCKGDSGGPLMVQVTKAYQVGITSYKFVERCGEDGVPSIFTRVSEYIEWILDNMES